MKKIATLKNFNGNRDKLSYFRLSGDISSIRNGVLQVLWWWQLCGP